MNLLLIAILIGAALYGYYWFLGKKTQPAIVTHNPVHFEAIVPTAEAEEMELSFEEEWELNKPVLIEEADTVLLLEAEKLVTDVDAIVKTNHDVYLKLKQAIPGYALLHHTEYYEPVNRFIEQTVKRECQIELTDVELAALWQ